MIRRLYIIFIVAIFVSFSRISFAESDKPYWVYFRDKGITSPLDLENKIADWERKISSRSLVRRSKCAEALISEKDLPVFDEYIYNIENLVGRKIRNSSRWLNAISINLYAAEVVRIKELPFVRKIEPVARFNPPPIEQEIEIEQPPEPRRDDYYEYGSSLRQISFLNTQYLHNNGLRGQGVLIGLCDAGFDNLQHNCFRNINIVATHDFVNGDDDVGDGDDLGRGDHGTKTLSIIAALDPGRMVGFAPEAAYVLAKTENTEWERPVEEDYWVAAIEWMDVLGVDIVSSSLGYNDWYNYEDLDGRHAVITIAADRATEVGMVIVNSIGNRGMNNYPNDKMGAPADGFMVYSIGGTNRDSTLAVFSSHGPTYDGRIKPDFTTYANGVVFASSRNQNDYGAGLGTSFSCPAIAGLCALLIQSNPYLTPSTLREALRDASHNRESPDTLLGWGIPDGRLALNISQPPHVSISIPLRRGWNTISANIVIPPTEIFTELFTDLVERRNLSIVKDGQGRFYYPNEQFNNIPYWDYLAGYQVRVFNNDTLVLSGHLAPYTQPIPLNEGWQIVSYLPNFPMPVREACRTLESANALQIIKDSQGRFYIPLWNFDNLQVLRPYQGYHIKLLRDATLLYPRQRNAEYFENGYLDESILKHFNLPEPQNASMSILLLAGEGITDGDEVAIVDDYGTFYGVGVFRDKKCGVAIWNDTDSDLEILIWKSHINKIYKAKFNSIQGELKYEKDGIAIGEISLTDAVNSKNPSISILPNPFNEHLEIVIEGEPLRNIEIKIWNIKGSEVFQSNSTTNSTGKAKKVILTKEWSNGVYLTTIRIGESLSTYKLIHLK